MSVELLPFNSASLRDELRCYDVKLVTVRRRRSLQTPAQAPCNGITVPADAELVPCGSATSVVPHRKL